MTKKRRHGKPSEYFQLTMRGKHVFFLVVVSTQVSLVVFLIHLIRACNKTPKPVQVQLGRTRKTDNVNYYSDMVGRVYSTLPSFYAFPTMSTSTQKQVFQRNNSDKEKMNNSETAMNNRTHNRREQTAPVNQENPRKKRLKLVVTILSAPIRFDRREGIRRTWMTQCTSEEVVCRFFTDSLSDMEMKVQRALMNESAKYGDIEFMPIPKGYNFGLRLLWLMEWSMERYDFDFYLRMDDDYFVCLKRLLFEIPFRPQKRLYWGYVHCEVEGLVRIDEGFLLLARDLVQEFMSKKDFLLCHPFGDQTVALWMNDVKNVIYFHDPRIYHHVTAHIPEFKSLQEVCGTYISLHGSYLHEMLLYWETASKNNYSTYWVPSIQPISNLCPLSTHFDWRAMGGPPYGWEPKPCVLKPLWNIGKMHRGRNMM